MHSVTSGTHVLWNQPGSESSLQTEVGLRGHSTGSRARADGLMHRTGGGPFFLSSVSQQTFIEHCRGYSDEQSKHGPHLRGVKGNANWNQESQGKVRVP